MPLKFYELLFAFEFVSAGYQFENAAYLNTETGVIHYRSDIADMGESVPDDVETSDNYIEIPHKNELDLGKRLALSFAHDMLPDVVEDVYAMFRRKGAYGHFKSLLEDRDMLQQWHDYELASTEKALREWCEENGVELE